MIAANTIVGGRYRVLKPLGGGGMKLVYLAEDLRLAARSCALAEMVDTFTSPDMQKQAVAAFQREADMLAQLSNEHIPRVFDRFSEQNHHYLVMEYIEGITLEEKLRRAGGKLSESEVVDIALQVLDTLEYLHGLSPPVIYRDLKPSNVMLTPEGKAKLIDFGIARHFQPLSNATMIGTQGYAPPEQYRGKVEFRSDLYALGATMHHALSGRDPASEPPFSFPPLRSVAPGVTPALCDLVDQALKYDVVLRVADAAEFRDRLLAIGSGEPAAAASNANSGYRYKPSARSQMNLPLGSVPSAPTVLSTPAADVQCPRCGRTVPFDSRFCSYCASDFTRTLGREELDNEAQTVVLDQATDRASYSPPPYRLRRHRERGARVVSLLIALSLGGFLLTKAFTYFESSSGAEAPGGNEPGSAPAVPEPGEPTHNEPRLAMLRRALDAAGYNAVHFKMDGDTIVLWGTVQDETDRMMVQSMVFTVAGIVSIQDHLQVSAASAD